jgi:uncharacterized protein YjbI with pentapeptide repeats
MNRPEPQGQAAAAHPADASKASNLPPLAKVDDLDAIRTTVVDAASVSGGLWLSYLFVLFYLLVAAGGVTHRDLFLENQITLPILNVELPLKGFFWLGPALFLVLHSYVLLHFVLLSSKTVMLDTQLRAQIDDAKEREQLRRQLPINIFVQFLAGPSEMRQGAMGFLLRLIAWISLVIGPVALLVFFELQFLPYHSEWITMWQRIAVLIELILLWLLWPAILYGEATRRRWRRIGWGTGSVLVGISFAAIVLMFAIATFPGEWLAAKLAWFPFRQTLIAGKVDFIARKPVSLLSNRLVLSGLDVIDRAKFDTDAKIAAAHETASLRGRHLEDAVLSGAVLRKVDFTGAHLQGALLNFAQLQGARLGSAQLQRATLSEAQLQGAYLGRAQLQGAMLDAAQLQRATLSEAQLQGATLDRAQLQGAMLDAAQLQGAELFLAQLQGATLDAAQLQAATLAFAQLQAATLTFAQLQGATLEGAQLQGANLDHVQLQGAMLDAAQLQGATLGRAQLQGARLTGAFVWRTDVREADAQGARIGRIETGPKRRCRYFDVCDWDNFLGSLEEMFEHDVPAGSRREEALKRLQLTLNPAKPPPAEQEMARIWSGLKDASPQPQPYLEQLFELLREIGCASDGAPFVLTGLVRSIPERLFDSEQAANLAAAFLRKDCVGARGIAEDVRAQLEKLSDTAQQRRPP